MKKQNQKYYNLLTIIWILFLKIIIFNMKIKKKIKILFYRVFLIYLMK